MRAAAVNLDPSTWYERENPDPQYDVTLFRFGERSSVDTINLVTDRWGIRAGVVHFWQGHNRVYSISQDRVVWVRWNN